MNSLKVSLVGALGALLLLFLGLAPIGVLAQQDPAGQAPGSLAPLVLAQAPEAKPEQPAPVATAPAAPKEESWPSEFFKSLQFSGYLETSYTFNTQKPRPATGPENRGRIFDVNANEFMLNALELRVQKPVDKDNPFGFMVDALVGQTAPVIHSAGLFENDDNDPADPTDDSNEYFDLVQAYIQAVCPSTETYFKLGKMITHNGAEVIYRPENDNFSRSFLFGLAIPFTHTGFMVTQPLLKRDDGTTTLLDFTAGIANGWDNVKDNNESKLIMTSSVFSPMDAFTLYSNFYYSFSEQSGDNANGRTLFDLVAKVYPLPENQDLKFLVNFDWGGEEAAGVGGGYAEWYGFAGIVRYDFPLTGTEKNWFVAFRGEFFDDVDGSRTAAITTAGTTSVQLWELTLTLGYMPVKNILLAGEIRYDKADEQVFFHGSGDAAGEADETHQTTFALDAVFIF